MLLVTNNEKVRERFGADTELHFVEGGHADVLRETRALIHKGYRLLTHPLAGSVKPNETPFRSVALASQAGALDQDSLALIEDALAACRKFSVRPGRGNDTPEAMKEDFAEIDLRLMEGAITPHLFEGV